MRSMKEMKAQRAILAIGLAGVIASSADASILDFKSLAIDFTNASDAGAKATWAEPDKMNVATNGLGWDEENASSRDGWIQTIPLALGVSWRPPYAVSVRVSIHPKLTEFALNSGQKSPPYSGNVYVRYSSDLQHWSTWHVLQPCEPQSSAEKQNPGRHFSGAMRIPFVEREEYSRLISEYSRLDVPWKSDEDATVRWIIENNPDFFVRQLPFMGYIQFRYEAGFHGGQRITSLKADVLYGMSGIHSAPKDKDAYNDRDSRPWSFKAEQIKQEKK